MLVREPCNSFNRRLKVMTAFSMMSLAMLVVLLRQRVPSLDRFAAYDVHRAQYGEAIFLGTTSLLIAIVVIQPVCLLVR